MKRIWNCSVQKMLSCVLVFALLGGLLPAQAATTSTPHSVSNQTELDAAIADINLSDVAEHTIDIAADFTYACEKSGSLQLNKNETSILGHGHTITVTMPDRPTSRLITVNAGATLHLGATDGSDTLVLDGNQESALFLYLVPMQLCTCTMV